LQRIANSAAIISILSSVCDSLIDSVKIFSIINAIIIIKTQFAGDCIPSIALNKYAVFGKIPNIASRTAIKIQNIESSNFTLHILIRLNIHIAVIIAATNNTILNVADISALLYF
jgi:hypothetical protein